MMKTMYEAYQSAQIEVVTNYLDRYNSILRNLDGMTEASTAFKGAEEAAKWIDKQSGRLEKMLEKMPNSLNNVRSLIKGEITKQHRRQKNILDSNSGSKRKKRDVIEGVVNEYDGNYYVILPIRTSDARQNNETMNFIYKHCFDTMHENGMNPRATSFKGYIALQTKKELWTKEAEALGARTPYVDFQVSVGYFFEMPKPSTREKKKKIARPADPKDPTKENLRKLFRKGWNVQNVMEMYPELPEWHLRGIKAGVTKQMQNEK